MNQSAAEMNVVAASIQSVIKASTTSGLSHEEACLSALIGILSYLRVEGIHEERLWNTAQRAVPIPFEYELIQSIRVD